MKIIKSDNSYKVYSGDAVQMLDKLPAAYYRVDYNQMTGWSLVQAEPLTVTEKAYGENQKKVDKILKKFKSINRNLGVLLGGQKGIGKSFFARRLCIAGVEQGYPVIIIDKSFSDLSDFLSQLTQPMVVLFDEFDKLYRQQEDADGDTVIGPQNGLLSLFDGVASTRMLFVITCNEVHGISEFLINRPGRIHYYLRFESPSVNEVETYLADKLINPDQEVIKAVGDFTRRTSLTYDALRAITEELNDGNDFPELLNDLNIVNSEFTLYDVELDGPDLGVDAKDHYAHIKFFSNETFNVRLRDTKTDDAAVEIEIDPSSLQWNDSVKGYVTNEVKGVYPYGATRKELTKKLLEAFANHEITLIFTKANRGFEAFTF